MKNSGNKSEGRLNTFPAYAYKEVKIAMPV